MRVINDGAMTTEEIAINLLSNKTCQNCHYKCPECPNGNGTCLGWVATIRGSFVNPCNEIPIKKSEYCTPERI